MILFICSWTWSTSTYAENSNKEPAKVKIVLRINKLYNISTINETYDIDGYISVKWTDSTLQNTDQAEAKLYINGHAKEQLAEIWSPHLEFINSLKQEEKSGELLTIKPTGEVILIERFRGTFQSQMDFRKFPFDNQRFRIILESFPYSQEDVVFSDIQTFIDKDISAVFTDEWQMLSWKNYQVESFPYYNLEDAYSDTTYFSRANFTIEASRMTGYYTWQVLLPLALIIMSSWVIFWLKDQGNQLSIAFTLMLTVVAFNFYSANFLPKLAYNTFIESVIISGYVYIFINILCVITQNWVTQNLINPVRYSWLLRLILPFSYLAMLMVIYCIFF